MILEVIAKEIIDFALTSLKADTKNRKLIIKTDFNNK